MYISLKLTLLPMKKILERKKKNVHKHNKWMAFEYTVIMVESNQIIIEIDRDSFSHYLLIWGCHMISSSSRLPDDMALLMLISRKT